MNGLLRMGLSSDLTDFEKGMIVGARRAGLSIAKTVKLLGFSKAAISRVYSKWTRTQDTSSKRVQCGRRPLVDERGKRLVDLAIKINRQSTVRQLTLQYNIEVQRPVSERTMRRTLRMLGYSKRPRRANEPGSSTANAAQSDSQTEPTPAETSDSGQSVDNENENSAVS